MKHIRLFENFDSDNIDILSYVEDYWNVDPEYLKAFIRHELEDNSLEKLVFIMEKGSTKTDNRFFIYKNELEVFGITKNLRDTVFGWLDGFEKIEERKPYPSWNDNKAIVDSTKYSTSVYYTNGFGNYFPEIILYLDKDSAITENTKKWEKYLNGIFKRAGIPYMFGDLRWYDNNTQICCVLYHT